MMRREESSVFAIAVLCGLLIAASNVGHVGNANIMTAYLYWLVRVLIEATLFVAFREVIEKFSPRPLSEIVVVPLAILTSLFPFVLAITAFDIVLGFPELGLVAGETASSPRLTELALELVYLMDNHVVLCLLLSVPRYMSGWIGNPETDGIHGTGTDGDTGEPVSYLNALDPPLAGAILWAEAQEHYVRVITSAETRMVLHRFTDVLRGFPQEAGLRVHRSHWVAFAAIDAPYRDGANLRIRLRTGDTVPVSRSYRKHVEEALAARRPAARNAPVRSWPIGQS